MSNLLNFLVFISRFDDGGDVISKTKLIKGLRDMIARNGLLGVLLRDIVGLGGDKGDEFDTALDEKVTRFLGKVDSHRGRQDLAHYLLNGR